MKTQPASTEPQDKSNKFKNQVPDQQLLSTLAEELETDENVEKLAKKLASEWTKPTNNSEAPSLPFSSFLDKLKKAKDQ